MRAPDLPTIEELFPKLTSGNYEVTSDAVSRYNCVAWAVGSVHHWWEALHVQGFYWPPGVLRDGSLQSWIQAFELHGFKSCPDGNYEPEQEKLAIYVDASDDPQHVARQLSTGEWTSKLGELEDIRHTTLDILEGDEADDYGRAKHFLKRHRPDWKQNQEAAEKSRQ
jgi:hypothetical protein